jgi:excisionase family DNA binding protein
VSVEDFRRQHGLGRQRVYEAIHRGELPHVRLGRKILVPADALDLLLRVQFGVVRKEGADAAA